MGLSNATLTNILATMIAPYWAMNPNEKNLDLMAGSPFLKLLRTQKRFRKTNSFKTGFNVQDQTISSVVESGTLEVSLAAEKIQLPDYAEYNFAMLNKLIKLDANILKMIEKTYRAGYPQDQNAADRKAYMRQNIEYISDSVMPQHFHQMFMDIEDYLLGAKTGSYFKGLKQFLNPATGGQTIGGCDLSGLPIKHNRPLWVAPSTGVGATGYGTTLTGEPAIGYNKMMTWHMKLNNVQKYRKGRGYDITLVSPTVNSRLGAEAIDRLSFNADARAKYRNPDGQNPMVVPKTGSLPLDAAVQVILNGVPVVESPSCQDNDVWLINFGALNFEVFRDEYANEIYQKSQSTKEIEALISVFVRKIATTDGNWNDDALTLMRVGCQMSLNDPSGIAAINFDSASLD